MGYLHTRGGLVADTAATAKTANTVNLCNILNYGATRIGVSRDFLPKSRVKGTIKKAQQSQKIQTNSRRQLVKTVQSGKQRSSLYGCVFFFLGFQLGEGSLRSLHSVSLLLSLDHSLTLLFLHSFCVMTP